MNLFPYLLALVLPLAAAENLSAYPPLQTRADLQRILREARASLTETVNCRSTAAAAKQLESCMEDEMGRADVTHVSYTLRSDGLMTLSLQFEPTARMLAAVQRPELLSRLTPREQETLSAARQLVRRATAGRHDPADKVRALHDALVQLAHYDRSRGMEAWDVLLPPHGGVCLAYARAFQLMLTLAGIPNRQVVGWAKEDHAWNLVQLDRHWYHADCTWDDPVVRGSREQTLLHDYFLRTDTQMRKTHRWNIADYPAADGPELRAAAD